MKLSDAIALGRVVIPEINPATFCGCALAMGLIGAGKEPCQADSSDADRTHSAALASQEWCKAESKTWPWILECQEVPQMHSAFGKIKYLRPIDIISDLFWDVNAGTISLDQLIDWVRSVEPQEPETIEVSTSSYEGPAYACDDCTFATPDKEEFDAHEAAHVRRQTAHKR